MWRTRHTPTTSVETSSGFTGNVTVNGVVWKGNVTRQMATPCWSPGGEQVGVDGYVKCQELFADVHTDENAALSQRVKMSVY